mmetsp:Transcript_63901/g.140081  ORF Transcript_63901/g.140081 Transcript_63901/m.140081 type:complete len:99 (-) Transcript_63901:416-712(-)
MTILPDLPELFSMGRSRGACGTCGACGACGACGTAGACAAWELGGAKMGVVLTCAVGPWLAGRTTCTGRGELKRGDSTRVRVGDSGRGESCRRQGKAW